MDDCRISTETVAGWRALALENDLLRVVLLPDKGADLYHLIHKPSGIDVLCQADWGLQPPGALPREGSGDREYMWNYEGGWQELFPSANYACTYRGRPIPFHGEVATMGWEQAVVQETAEEVAVAFSARCRQTPFRLERQMRLERGHAALHFDETIHNESDSPAHFVWGHHCVVGAPFLEAGCRLDTSARSLFTAPQVNEHTARLAPSQHETWPMARLRDGGTVDLRHVPGPEAHTHDVAFLTDLTGGWVAVSNPRLDLTFRIQWDAEVFKWLIVWQPYGGCEAMPLTGFYGLGIEPWTAQHNLEGAIADGEAIELAAGASFSTALQATISKGAWPDRQ
jgi:galactose mutarotase-like enzyme